ncbi:hypothetical protein AB0H73_14810 [Streptomyces olivoreticuli]
MLALLILSGLLYPLIVRTFAPHDPRARRLAVASFTLSLLLALIAWDRW